jgi:guanosine-3',5'-bis(diphosphate) 3'-pyrophosphohydrolase
MILKVAAFAAWMHRDQRRKDADASPYINHPLALAAVLGMARCIAADTEAPV